MHKPVKKSVRRALVLLALHVQVVPALAQTLVVSPDETYQTIQGFGGMNGVGWIPDLTPAEIATAFGSGDGQIGLSIMRVRIDPAQANWSKLLPSTTLARSLGAILLATPWSPPAEMKSNGSLINGGKLLPADYPVYAEHLQSFADFMAAHGAPLYALSLQNEPDWHPKYESAVWNGDDIMQFLSSQGGRFRGVKLLAAESLRFDHSLTDPALNTPAAARYLDIVGGHLYGARPADYPLARNEGKPLWVTEHFTDNTDGDAWPSALGVATELNESLTANMSAYIWWYIRRSYGLLSEQGAVTKRGFVMAQYARFVRPGAVRIGATPSPYPDVAATAFRQKDGSIVLELVNTGTQARQLEISVPVGTAREFAKYSTSASLDVAYGGQFPVTDGKATFTAEPLSVTTLIGR